LLTSRGYWFLLIVSLVVILGVVAVPTWSVAPAVMGLALLAWFAYEWVRFRWRLTSAIARLRVERVLVQGDRIVPMVWAGIPFRVRVTIQYPSGSSVPYAFVEDRIPLGVEILQGTGDRHSALRPGQPLEVEYELRVAMLGMLRFEGLRVRVVDLQGFFFHHAFLREGVEYLVLPPLTDDEGRQRADKRFNMLPPPGIHRFRRPGTGSELLDLRDYRPGDPPKMIAWKASARRDRLIIKEYESDVPVRCVLFLDASQSAVIGPPGETATVRLATLASGVAQAAAANRDLVGLTVFDENDSRTLAPARTRTHLITMMQRLAETAARLPDVRHVHPEELSRRATYLARSVYPELMTRGSNAVPFGRHWIPLLDARWGWLAVAAIAATPFLVIQKEWLRATAGIAWATRLEATSGIVRFLSFLGAWACIAFSPALVALGFWFLYSFRGWFNPRWGALNRRKRLASLLCLRDGTGAAGIERLIHDDQAFAEAVAKFLTEHRLRCPFPLHDEDGRYLFRGEAKVEILANSLLQAVSRARDNELYVVLADLVELGPNLARFLKAARVARSKHHQVLVIVPWPADLEEPAPKPEKPERSLKGVTIREGKLKAARRGSQQSERERLETFQPALRAAFRQQFEAAYQQLRRELARAGVTAIRLNPADSVQVVLDRLDRLRGLRTRR